MRVAAWCRMLEEKQAKILAKEERAKLRCDATAMTMAMSRGRGVQW